MYDVRSFFRVFAAFVSFAGPVAFGVSCQTPDVPIGSDQQQVACNVDGDCPNNQTCINGFCCGNGACPQSGCMSDAECAMGEICVNGQCTQGCVPQQEVCDGVDND